MNSTDDGGDGLTVSPSQISHHGLHSSPEFKYCALYFSPKAIIIGNLTLILGDNNTTAEILPLRIRSLMVLPSSCVGGAGQATRDLNVVRI